LDPFLGRIHQSIHEFEPLWTAVARAGWSPYADELFIGAGVLLVAVVWWMRKPSADQRIAIILAGVVVLGATVLGCIQNRWLLTASAPQIVLAVVLLTGITVRRGEGTRIALFAIAGMLWFAPGPWTLANERQKVAQLNDVQMGETLQLLYRDIAGALRKTGASGDSIVLTDPNASVGVGYYGQFRTVGTLYWENRDGLLAAAEMLDAGDDAEVAARIHLHGVTHVALVSSHDFLSEYHYALTGNRTPARAGEGVGHRLLYEHRVPMWLRPIDYHVPAPLVPLGIKVELFAVDFSAPAAVAHERIGVYQLAKGASALAEASFMASLTADASRPAPWLLEGRLMLESGRFAEAASFFQAGILRAPERDREPLIRALVALLEQSGPDGQARARALVERLGASAGKP
ncbi:MAG TPA: hypothetical protein VIM48_08615, partial [Chthoniobacterales bacterium]